MPSLLPSHIIILLTFQEYIPRQEIASLDPPPLGFEPQMQSTVLQNELQLETESRDLTLNKTAATHYITVREQQFQI